MEKITKTFDVFSFDELSKEVQSDVLDKFRHHNVEFDEWYDYIFEDFIDEQAKNGFIIEKKEVFFSGFGSQGDGASFKASVDLEKWLFGRNILKKYRQLIQKANFIITANNNHYCHAETMDIDFNALDLTPKNELLANKLADLILDDAKDQANKLYKKLEDNFFYLTSDDAIKETIEANDYQFLADGSIFNN